MKTASFAEEVESGLRQHFDECRSDEANRFGRACDYKLDVQTIVDADGTEIINIATGTAPTPEAAEAFGKSRTHLGKKIESRFWMRGFEYRYDPATGVISFYRQNEHGWVRDASTTFGDPDLQSWNARRLDAIARHVTGRTASSEKPAELA